MKLLIALLLLASCAHKANYRTARAGFAAWEKGESGQGYQDFEALLSSDFRTYSHPLQPSRGVFRGAEALTKMRELVSSRQKNPNALKFTLDHQTCGKNACAFAFTSKGTVAGGYPYEGWNVILLEIEKDKIVGFREYLGDIDPAWFQKK